MIDRESLYADLIARVANIFAVSNNYYIKIQLLREKPDCLITISSDEASWNMLVEHENVVGSSLTTRVCLFILKNESSPPIGAMLVAMKAKMKVPKCNAYATVGGFVESNLIGGRRKNRHHRGKKERESASSPSNAYSVHGTHVTEEVTWQSPEMKGQYLSRMGSP